MIQGEQVALRPAESVDQRTVYEWMAHSDITPSMMGPPLFPETPIPTWEEFLADYRPHYFDGSQPTAGRSYIIEADGQPVGHISHTEIEGLPAVKELDIWLHSRQVCGKGYGTDALKALVGHLHDTLGVTEFILRPSRRNPAAIRSYQKAGFAVLELAYADQLPIYGPGDYADTVVLRYAWP